MMTTKNTLLTIALATIGFQQMVAQDYPPNAEPGKCYAKCMVPDVYENITEEILVKQATQRINIVPAQYEQRTERVMVKAASSRIEVIPAVYETVTERVEVKPASFRLVSVPATYKTITENTVTAAEKVSLVEVPAVYETTTEQVETAPATTKWVKRQGDANCLSQDPEDCLVWCLIEVPAEYKTITKTIMTTPPSTRSVTTAAKIAPTSIRVIDQPATTRRVEIPAEYKTITKTVLVKAAETRTIEIPAEYRDVRKEVAVQAATSEVVNIPAEYRTISNRRLVKKGGFSEWREVLCQNKINTVKIREIQAALKSRGYQPGPVDNIMGSQTKAALVQFQKDNNLPIGQLDFETLRALGVGY